MNIQNEPKVSLVSICNALVTGLSALPNTKSIVANGQTYTLAEVLAPLKAYAPLPAATAEAKSAYSAAVAKEAAAKAAAAAMIEDVAKPYLQQRLGKSSPALVNYGLEPVKVPQKSAATKAAAAQKSAATRKALGTKGPDQRKAAKKALAAPPAAPASTKSSS